MNTSSIPIIVGIAGHRSFDPSCEDKIYAAVKRALAHIQKACPHSPVQMLTNLAEGAGLLCARAAEEMRIELLAALPMDRNACRKELSPEDAKMFDRYCDSAAALFVAPPTEKTPENPDRNFFLRQAGIYIAGHSHLLIALWDGTPSESDAYHTANAVDFALNGHYQPKKGIALRSGANEAVVHIFAPQPGGQTERAGETAVLGDRDAVSDILEKTDHFNSLAGRASSKEAAPASNAEDWMEARAEHLYQIADGLSSAAAYKFKRLLGLTAVISTLFALSFLLYDEANITWMILLCGLMLLATGGCLLFAKKSDCHWQYVEYRVLAEYLRVQAYLFRAGSSIQSVSLMPWSQQCENTWIMAALCAVTIGNNPHKPFRINDSWIGQQQQYHQSAITSTGKKVARNNRIINMAMCFSVVLYIAALLYESLFGNLFAFSFAEPGCSDLIRNGIKVFLGMFSAGTMFIANYYGKIALDRRLSDHEKMAKFFKKLYDSISQYGQTEELLEYLAREELIENGNWYSYQISNKPDLSI